MRLDSVSFVGVQWAAIALLFALVHDPLAAQVWTQMATTGPSPRSGHTMVYDSQRQRTVLFGGNGYVGYLGDTWEWDGTTWAQVASGGPPARSWHAMAYDSQRQRTVLFGGDNSGGALGDTWEWNGTTWMQVATTGPSARYYHAMAYDSLRNRTLMFGGRTTGGSPASYFGDTWEWDGITWSQVAVSGPSNRSGHAMAYDSQRNRTVLFGGRGYFPRFRDTWEWDGSAWAQVASAGPTYPFDNAMAYDSQRRRTVLLDGATGATLGYIWEWDGTTWMPVATTGPSARTFHEMAYDSQRARIVLFGGSDVISNPLGDTWEWTGGLVSTATTFGTGCGGLGGFALLYPVANARPIINTTAQAMLTLTNISSTLAMVALGWSDTQLGTLTLPLPLAPYGMPGCALLQSTDASATVVINGGAATYSLPLPNMAGLIGLHLYLQGWAYAPGANAGDMVVSNGVEWVIGNS